MDQFKNIYKSWIENEVQSPEVQEAKELFLERFSVDTPLVLTFMAGAISAALRMSLVGALALFILVKTSAFEPSPEMVLLPESVRLAKVAESIHRNPKSVKSMAWEENYTPVKIKKLSSQMGTTVVYSKPFADAQVTVIWVLPRGV